MTLFLQHTPNPTSGASFPRLQIENRLYAARPFRKIHIGLFIRQDGLQVLQTVIYPQYEFDLPLLFVYVVIIDNSVRFASVDLPPVRWRRSNPDFLSDAMRNLQAHFRVPCASPSWGQKIFSPLCVSVKPDSEEETDSFIQYTCSLIRAHLEAARLKVPIQPRKQKLLQEIKACHLRFNCYQRKNEKLRRILLKSFGEKKAHEIINQFMFPTL